MGADLPVGGTARLAKGTVLEELPRLLYRVRLESGQVVTAHAAATARGADFIRLVVGDRVAVELTARDETRGRIERRLKEGE